MKHRSKYCEGCCHSESLISCNNSLKNQSRELHVNLNLEYYHLHVYIFLSALEMSIFICEIVTQKNRRIKIPEIHKYIISKQITLMKTIIWQ